MNFILKITCMACVIVVFQNYGIACSVTASNINFGVINPISGTDTTTTSSITVTCPSTTSFSASLSPGSGSYSQRIMLSGANSLKYNIFLDSAHTIIWGDGTSITGTWSGQADSTGSTHSVFAHAPYQPNAIPGTYIDSITVTVTY